MLLKKFINMSLAGKDGYKMICVCLTLHNLNSSALFLAIINQQESIVKLLSENPKIDINQEMSINDGNIFDLGYYTEDFLTTATCIGNIKIVQYLSSNPNLAKDDTSLCDPNFAADDTPHYYPNTTIEEDGKYDPIAPMLHLALQNRNKEVIQFFLKKLKFN